jgi:hypothetical protein
MTTLDSYFPSAIGIYFAPLLFINIIFRLSSSLFFDSQEKILIRLKIMFIDK